MNYYNLLEPYDRELWVIHKTGTISGSTQGIRAKVEALLSIYELQYKKKPKDGCNGKCVGRALRILAKDYQELKAKDLEGKLPVYEVTMADDCDPQIALVEDSPNPFVIVEEGTKLSEVYYSQMKYQQLRALCKEKNIPLNKKDKRQDLIDKLNAHS